MHEKVCVTVRYFEVELPREMGSICSWNRILSTSSGWHRKRVIQPEVKPATTKCRWWGWGTFGSLTGLFGSSEAAGSKPTMIASRERKFSGNKDLKDQNWWLIEGFPSFLEFHNFTRGIERRETSMIEYKNALEVTSIHPSGTRVPRVPKISHELYLHKSNSWFYTKKN